MQDTLYLFCYAGALEVAVRHRYGPGYAMVLTIAITEQDLGIDHQLRFDLDRVQDQ